MHIQIAVYCFEAFLAAAFSVSRGPFSAVTSLFALVFFELARISASGDDAIVLSIWGLSVLPRAMMAAAPTQAAVGRRKAPPPLSKKVIEAFEVATVTPLPDTASKPAQESSSPQLHNQRQTPVVKPASKPAQESSSPAVVKPAPFGKQFKFRKLAC
jgi:hypothetical protein